MNSATFQQYIRIGLYTLFSGLGAVGVSVPDNTKTLVLSIVGYAATFAWTMWGTRLNGLLEQVKAKTGVQSIEIRVDPELIPPSAVTANTSAGIVATPAR